MKSFSHIFKSEFHVKESLKGKVRKEKGAYQGSRLDMIIVGQGETGFK